MGLPQTHTPCHYHEPYLCAWIDRWPDSEPAGAVQQHSVQQVGLPCSVHSGHGDNAQGSLQLAQELARFVVDLETYGKQ